MKLFTLHSIFQVDSITNNENIDYFSYIDTFFPLYFVCQSNQFIKQKERQHIRLTIFNQIEQELQKCIFDFYYVYIQDSSQALFFIIKLYYIHNLCFSQFIRT